MSNLYEHTIFGYFDNIYRLLKIQPLNLGGVIGWSGGEGGPPGGFVGQLPQSRVAYDLSEESSWITPPSGASILDNLNHIRYRLDTVEASGSPGSTIKQDGIEIADGVTIIDFVDNFEVISVPPDGVTVSLLSNGTRADVTYSGVYGESLTTQINGITQHFDVVNEFHENDLAVYVNGVRLSTTFYVVDGDKGGFTLTDYTPVSGDTLTADYAIAHEGLFHTHSQYITASGYYTITETDALLSLKANLVHTHVEADIVDLDHDATSIQGVDVSAIPPINGQALIFDATTGEYIPTLVSGSGTGGGSGYPDTPKPVPTLYDDEFDDGVLDPKWTVTVIDGSGTVSYDEHTTWPDNLCIKFVPAGDVQRVTIEETIIGGSTFSVTGCFHIPPQSKYQQIRMALTNAAGTEGLGLTYQYNNDAYVSTAFTMDHSIIAGWNYGYIPIQVPIQNKVYLHIQRISTDYWEMYGSFDGYSWLELGAGSANPTFFFDRLATAERLKIIFTNDNYGELKSRFGVDWIRYNWLTL